MSLFSEGMPVYWDRFGCERTGRVTKSELTTADFVAVAQESRDKPIYVATSALRVSPSDFLIN